MFSITPKQVELTTAGGSSKRRKGKSLEIAEDYFNNLSVKVDDLLQSISDIKLTDTGVEVRKGIKQVTRETKEVRKLLNKVTSLLYKKKRPRSSHNTGLEKPRPISEAMAAFMAALGKDWEFGVKQASRYEVTNELCRYIKENELRDSDNKTIIIPDAKLQDLLQWTDDERLTYPKMQKNLKYCFDEIPKVEEVEVEEVKRVVSRKTKVVVEEVKPVVKKSTKKETPKIKTSKK
jgi:chromatin remodeling complex protein RSC6